MATRSQHHHGLLLLTNLASSCVALQALLWRLWRIAGHILPGYSDRKFIGIHTLPNSIRDHNSLLNLVAGKAKALDPLFQLTLAQAFIALSLFEATRTCDESTTVSAGCDGFLTLFLEILNLCISLRSDRFRQAPKRNGCPLPQLIHTKTAMTNPSQHLCCLCSHWVKGRDNNKTGKPQIRLKTLLVKAWSDAFEDLFCCPDTQLRIFWASAASCRSASCLALSFFSASALSVATANFWAKDIEPGVPRWTWGK